ncbi:Alkyl hydroperoxide reductase C [Buchnera aphidicola (Eriosoma lanigerum)]|uniref:peroxiredoxin n=1 Tax=Buchnera aphidicola TaxID=9 RepID=UPI003464ABC1
MILVGRTAPNFISSAILKNGKIIHDFNLKEQISSNKGCILFFWPLDFTFVCPTELLAFNSTYSEFQKRNIALIGVSIDSVFAHEHWRNTSIDNGGIGPMQFTMVSDIKREIQQLYNIEHPELGIALRATFFIDQHNIIRHQSINDLPIGRNIQEILRIIDAVTFHEKNGEVCPANWNNGKPGITASQEGIKQYLKNKYIYK